jgi:predicted ATPase
MAGPTIEHIDIEGFTSIVEASVGFGRLNVLVGANGAGKSNLVRALELLGRIVDEDLQVHVRRSGEASALINATLTARQIRLSLFGRAKGEIRYDAALVPTPDGGLFFADEHIYYRDPEKYQTWWNVSIERGHRESKLHETAAAGGRGSATAAAVIDLLQGCRVYHFHDTSAAAPVKRPISTADNLALRPDAANLAALLLRLRESSDRAEQAAYRRIVGSVRQVAPFFRDFVLVPEGRDQVRLRWREDGADAVFSAHQMSDGTLRFICLTALLLQPTLPALVVLDEPELGLHPYAIVQLADLLRQAATRSQIIIATQSVTLMNQFELADLIVVERDAAGSSFVRPDAARLDSWLQEYSLGELWEKNLIGGRPGSVAGSTGG